jgi:hypothetical protein
VVSILSRMATEHHLVVALAGAESLFRPMPMLLRAGVLAPEARRAGNLMPDQRLERPAVEKSSARWTRMSGRPVRPGLAAAGSLRRPST